MITRTYDVLHHEGIAPIKMWTQGVPVEDVSETATNKHR